MLGREEDGEPAVGDLPGEAQVARPDGGEVDGQVGPRRAEGEAQCLAGAVGQRQREVLALVEHLLAPQGHPDDLDVLARPGQGRPEAHAVPPLAHLRAGDPEAEGKRPPVRVSSVAAVIAVIAGVRAGICMTPAPRPMVEVWAPSQARTVGASEPYASATQACA